MGRADHDSAELHSIRCTIGVSRTVPPRELRSELSQVIDQVADLRAHVIVTRRGRPAAVLRGRLRRLRSLRTGAYRVIYQLDERQRGVRVLAVRHRSVAYVTDPS